MALSGTLLAVAAHAELTQALDLGAGRAPQSLTRKMQLASGTGVGKADRVWSDRRTIAASGSEDLDLAGVLLDAFGAAVTFARVKGLIIAAAVGNTNNVVVGAASGSPWITLLGATHTLTLRPGAFVAVGTGETDATGYAVTASTGDLLKIANSAGSTGVTYDIHIIGSST
ncbi:hypothetical protein ACFYQA_08275 [Streptomyces sp. NPDC005774]|uniref:hypothetical protein n=1 Tax=Streptomyces sp. NPDC005774 TaxID=3364728 RepID=UPI0036AA0CDB